VDLWEVAFQDVPPGVELEILDGAGRVIADNHARFRTRILMVPIKGGNDYSLRARVPRGRRRGMSSPVLMRRWIVQQDGLYSTTEPLTDVAGAGSYAYAAGPSGLDVITLKDPLRPLRAAHLTQLAGATSLSVLDTAHLLAAVEGLEVLSLVNPEQPAVIASLSLSSGIRAVCASSVGGQNLAAACGAASYLHVVDLSNPSHPEEIGSVPTRVQPTRVLMKGTRALLLGKEGLELFDLSMPGRPASIGLLTTKREVRNAAVVGSFVVLAYDSRSLDIIDISKPKLPRIAGSLQMEGWAGEFTPLAGAIVRLGGRVLALKSDQLGFRVLRLLRNHVNGAALQHKRTPIVRV
jgi:hypothetical protein